MTETCTNYSKSDINDEIIQYIDQSTIFLLSSTVQR